jgi:hypothetical protein
MEKGESLKYIEKFKSGIFDIFKSVLVTIVILSEFYGIQQTFLLPEKAGFICLLTKFAA